MDKDALMAEWKAAEDELIDAETKARQVIEASFNDFAKPFQDKFDADTTEARNCALDALQPHKQALTEEMNRAKRDFDKAADKATKKFGRAQLKLQKIFAEVTKVQNKELIDATAAKKAELDAEWEKIAANTDEKMRELRDKYTKLIDE